MRPAYKKACAGVQPLKQIETPYPVENSVHHIYTILRSENVREELGYLPWGIPQAQSQVFFLQHGETWVMHVRSISMGK